MSNNATYGINYFFSRIQISSPQLKCNTENRVSVEIEEMMLGDDKIKVYHGPNLTRRVGVDPQGTRQKSPICLKNEISTSAPTIPADLAHMGERSTEVNSVQDKSKGTVFVCDHLAKEKSFQFILTKTFRIHRIRNLRVKVNLG